ncbi:type VII secretion-associated serine protease mycosin [Actinoplanes sp. NPDC051346]|uniref:type VII secretion-associated serine protease mycosin n=1 Tax=Actinoplanes sp. NPDC051346 TaxID=3155048 RepID=UPI003433CD37
MIRTAFSTSSVILATLGSALFGVPALADEFRDMQWHLQYLRVAEAHTISTGRGVTVAVVDTGVSGHSDLAGSIVSGTDFIDPGGNGRNDLDGHGTAMAGLIAAHGKGSRGVLGIAPGAKVLPIRVLKDNREAELELGPAIDFAVKHGAKVINISAGGGTSPKTIKAVRAAADADVVIVAAAGNRPRDAGVISPAIFESVVAVTATDRGGKISDVSVTGPAIDLAAPGEDITTTSNADQYTIKQTGTSDAAAIVSGAAALLRSKYPDMTAKEVVQRLEDTATDKGAPGVDDEYGHGIVNIVAALKAGDTPTPGPQSSSAPGTPSTPTPTPKAAPETKPASNNTPLIAGAVIAVLVAGLGAVLWVRRRSSGGAR